MSKFACPVVRIASVTNHSGADRLSIVSLEGFGYLCISAKLEDGSPRYVPGDLVVYIPSSAVLPEWLLKDMGFWNEETSKGMLAGSAGDRVKPLKLRGIFSEGLLYPVDGHIFQDLSLHDMPTIPQHMVGWPDMKPRKEPTGACNWKFSIVLEDGSRQRVLQGDDVSEYLGITKWSPPIPVAMAGEVANLAEAAFKYDFERIESVPNLFDPNEQVSATEKLHGCLHGDSLVMLPNGEQVSIADVVQGNYRHVLSYDIENNDYIVRKITGKMRRPNIEQKPWVKLGLENGNTLTLTSDHPVYSRDRKMWIEAGKILPMEDIESPII